jgi:hypothetical protein
VPRARVPVPYVFTVNGRRRVFTREGAAVHIQACWRRRVVRNTLRALNSVAAIIQTRARARAARVLVAAKRRERRYRDEHPAFVQGWVISPQKQKPQPKQPLRKRRVKQRAPGQSSSRPSATASE